MNFLKLLHIHKWLQVLILLELKFILEKCLWKDRLIVMRNGRVGLMAINEINRCWRKLLEMRKILLKIWNRLNHNWNALLSLDWSNLRWNNIMMDIIVQQRELNWGIFHRFIVKQLSWVQRSLVEGHQRRIAWKRETMLRIIILVHVHVADCSIEKKSLLRREKKKCNLLFII